MNGDKTVSDAISVAVGATQNIAQGWAQRASPASLFRRLVFPGYADTRLFLDQLATLSRTTGCYPDISFGREYVNITVYAGNGETLTADELDFVRRVDEVAGMQKAAG